MLTVETRSATPIVRARRFCLLQSTRGDVQEVESAYRVGCEQSQLQRRGSGADADAAVPRCTTKGDLGNPGLDGAATSCPLVVRLDKWMSQPFGPVSVLPVDHVAVHIGIPMVGGDKQVVFWHYRTIGKIDPDCSSSARITIMISYAQNQEDVILDRALHSPKGFYVDVGAASPSIASVTRHFYEMGWSGINIEPQESYVAELRQERPRDLTLQAAAGAVPGTCTFYVVDSDPDLSTFDRSRVEDLASEGERTTTHVVEVVTLNDVLDRARPGAIDFLKIDVEGAERDVLLGIDLARWRPRVLVVESTISNTQTPNYEKWEDLVVGHGYVYTSFDGINRYYVAEEETSLIDRLGPANALDDYVPASLQLIHEELERLRGYIAHLEAEIARKDEHIAAIADYVRQLEHDVQRPSQDLPHST